MAHSNFRYCLHPISESMFEWIPGDGVSAFWLQPGIDLNAVDTWRVNHWIEDHFSLSQSVF